MRNWAVFYNLRRWFFPRENTSIADHAIARSLFLRGLGVVYLIAILSWWVQAPLLVGKNGLIPAGDFLKQIDHLSSFEFPAIFRVIGASDWALHLVCGLGCVLALVLIVGILPGPALLGLWGIYLSLLNTGGPFMSFQWDILLVESGFLAIWFAPWRCLRMKWKTPPPLAISHRVVLIFFWFLIAKLMFFSGWVKLAWAGPEYPEWSPDYTAMMFHYFTQPIPTWTAWWMHQLPAGVQKFSLWPMYFVELVLPFFVIAGPRCRQIAAIGFAGLMLLIATTGNYTYFNFLSVVLCIPLIADRFWPRRLLKLAGLDAEVKGHEKVGNESTVSDRQPNPVASWTGFGIRMLPLFVIAALNLQTVLSDLHRAPNPAIKADLTPHFLDDFSGELGAWRLVSGYGLFRTMTTTRPEIILEGSQNGITWQAYDFKWKPDRLDERPRFVAPHQPRVAWQLWFAALEQGYHPQSRNAGWISQLVTKLLEGDESVQALFRANPFPDEAPRYIRARLFDYEFTTIAEKRRSGAWWKRKKERVFLPPVSKRSP